MAVLAVVRACVSRSTAASVFACPVHFRKVFATLYHNLGIDLAAATVKDHTGRPHYLVDAGVKSMRELV